MKDIIIRALKTFVQAFIPVFIAGLQLTGVTELSEIKTALYSALISAAAAGISAIWNYLLTFWGGGKDEG